MTTSTHILVIQSRKTGRFLLRENNGVWNFAIALPFDDQKGMLFELLKEGNLAMGQAPDWDNYSIDFLDNFPNGTVFHGIVNDETLAPGSKDAWFPLFDFPENFDALSDTLFESQEFIERIISPYD